MRQDFEVNDSLKRCNTKFLFIDLQESVQNLVGKDGQHLESGRSMN